MVVNRLIGKSELVFDCVLKCVELRELKVNSVDVLLHKICLLNYFNTNH